MYAVTFIDSKVVTIISTADSTELTRVSRGSGEAMIHFDVACSVKNYGATMGGIDVIDRYLSQFSIVKGHSFKKWYKKAGLAVVDNLTHNSFVSWRLAKGVRNAREDDVRDDRPCRCIS